MKCFESFGDLLSTGPTGLILNLDLQSDTQPCQRRSLINDQTTGVERTHNGPSQPHQTRPWKRKKETLLFLMPTMSGDWC